MKKKLLKLAFIFSVIFNLVVVATIVYGAYFAGKATNTAKTSNATNIGGSPIDTLSIYQMLNLTEEQKRILRIYRPSGSNEQTRSLSKKSHA